MLLGFASNKIPHVKRGKRASRTRQNHRSQKGPTNSSFKVGSKRVEAVHKCPRRLIFSLIFLGWLGRGEMFLVYHA